MIEPNALTSIVARLKIYEASIQTAKLSTPNETLTIDGAGDQTELDHTELRRAIAALESTQTQISPGTLVRHKVTGEIGRVVTIFNTDGFDDTYVAFWGHEPPDPSKAPETRPYILRYCLSSLERL